MYIIPIIVCVLLIVIDQIIKFLTIKYILPVGSVRVIEKFFYLTYVENRGAAFGFLEGARWFFIIITIVILIIGGLYYIKMPKSKFSMLTKISIIMIASGAIGNAIDRIFRGYVVDLFHFIFWGYSFAVFNFADILVVCGTILFAGVVVIFTGTKEEVSNKKGNV